MILNNKKTMFLIKSLMAFLIFFFSAFSVFGQSSHFVLVLDTSLSTIRNGSFSHSKAIANEILKEANADDKISIFSFDSKVTKVTGPENINLTKQFRDIDNIRARGLWTYTSLMLQEMVKYLNSQSSQPIKLFIFSDGIDDPPKGSFSRRIRRYNKPNSNVFYLSYSYSNSEQRELIKKAFPNVVIKRLTKEQDAKVVTENLQDYFIPRIELNFQNNFSEPIISGVDSEIQLDIKANKAAAGQEVILKAEVPVGLFKNFEKQRDRIILKENSNIINLPYTIAYSAEAKSFKLNFSLAAPQDPLDPILSQEVNIRVAALPFIEKLYKLPLFYIPALIILAILAFIIYKIIRYQLFTPFIEMTYWYSPSRDSESSDKEITKGSIEVGALDNGNYTISSKADAFLVLPNLSSYDDLVLIKKGKKFKTKLRIHSSSIRNVSTLDGGRIKTKIIKNNATMKLGNYTLSFKNNLDKGKKVKK